MMKIYDITFILFFSPSLVTWLLDPNKYIIHYTIYLSIYGLRIFNISGIMKIYDITFILFYFCSLVW